MTSAPTLSAAESPWKTPRGRFLAVLAGCAAALVIAAGLALKSEYTRTAVRFEPELVFAGLAGKLDGVTGITIKDAAGVIDLKLGADKAWDVTSVYDYPAAGERVRILLIALSNLMAVERKTAQVALHGTLGVGDPGTEGGGTLVSVTDSKGTVLAALIAGKSVPGAVEGEERFYMRRVGSEQTFIARGTLPRGVSPPDWLDTQIVDVARERIKRVDVKPLQGPDYAIFRAKADDANFMLESVPKGRAPLNETAANPGGAALAGLTLDDVRKESEIDFSSAARDVYQTFDGLTVTVDIAQRDNAFWVRVKAAGTGDKEAEAAAINARVQGWAYKVSDWKGEVLVTAQERLLQSQVPGAPKIPGESETPTP